VPAKKNAGDAGGAREAAGSSDGTVQPARKPLKISTVSHTLDGALAERLRNLAFKERISESAVIEFALREFFKSADDATLGRRLREAGAALRRKVLARGRQVAASPFAGVPPRRAAASRLRTRRPRCARKSV
jgi:predicted transcriptional regulator